jgi:hypothetical protein
MTTKLLNPRELVARFGHETAMYAILTGNLGSSTVQPEVADRYIREMVNRTVIINDARRLPMNSNTRNIDRLTHSGRVMVFPNEGEPATLAGAIGFIQRQLIAGRLIAAEDWSQETIEDNIEGDNLGGTAHDGWLLLSDHLIDKQGEQPGLATDMFKELMDSIPDKYLDSYPRAEWRFYVNGTLERRYREELGERMTALGDRALFENVPVFYQGVPVVPAPSLRLETRDMVGGGDNDLTNVTDLLLVHPMNLVTGFRRDVTMDVERQPRKGMFELTLTARGDANVESPDSYATMINVKLPDSA